MQIADSLCRGSIFSGHALRGKSVLRIYGLDKKISARQKCWQLDPGLHENINCLCFLFKYGLCLFTNSHQFVVIVNLNVLSEIWSMPRISQKNITFKHFGNQKWRICSMVNKKMHVPKKCDVHHQLVGCQDWYQPVKSKTWTFPGWAKIGKHASFLGNKACACFVPPCHELILCRHYLAATTRPWFVQTLELWQLFGALATKAAHSFIELPENYQTIDSKTKTHNKGIESGPHCGTAGQGQAGWDADRKMRQEKQAYLVPS